jgi:2-oxoglutarate dehydrogenase E1 component
VAPSLNGWNAEYLEAQYQQYQQDPAAISPDLVGFFQGFDLAMARLEGVQPGAAAASPDSLRLYLGTSRLIEAYRRYGHFGAKVDPFGTERTRHTGVSLKAQGLSEADLDRPVDAASLPLPAGSTLRQVVDFLERTYHGSIGAEFMQVTDEQERAWLIERFERPPRPLAPAQRADVARQMIRSEQFEFFMQMRYPGDKRFSIEGGESLIPCLNSIINTAAAKAGVEEVVIGMPHRARINVLCHILNKSYHQVLTEFEDTWHDDFTDIGGDVQYHQGFSTDRTTPDGKSVHLTLSPNPSHLESVDGVVEGRARGKQRLRRDTDQRAKVLPLLMHGDAAVIAQGVVAEVLNYSRLDGYRTGGTIHVVVNNFVGFTTSDSDARSGEYCTDVALMVGIPIFHVNGEDPEAVVRLAELAVEFRQKFGRDFFIDLMCFRRYGHNEQDDASITQPRMAAAIKAKKGVASDYSARLVSEGVLSDDEVKTLREQVKSEMDQAQQLAKTKPVCPYVKPFSGRWKGIARDFSFDRVETAVPAPVIAEICAAIGRHPPEGFNVNPKLEKLLKERAALPQTKHISYADAESIAFGTLLLEGHGVRISGQDSRRGTFAHRMAVLRDTKTEEAYTPLNTIRTVADHPDDAGKPGPDGRPMQAKFCVYDSPLSEVSVMAFDYGYSLTDPRMLVMWEAQFGDFCNGAQAVIDQYLASAHVKWQRYSGLVLLLPHGYEGKGPEHSSARLERFLDLCADENMQVVYPSTAAQAFHMLRRQVKAAYRRPLIVMTPKSPLRLATSTIDELFAGGFQEILDDPAFVAGGRDRKKVSRIVLCTGKIYHELAARRDETGRFDTAIVRIEQLYPFHAAMFSKIMASYPNARERVNWVQEEPRNAGAFMFIADLLRNDPSISLSIGYIGRPATASPAVGSKHRHLDQQAAIVAEAIAPPVKEKAGGGNGVAGHAAALAPPAPVETVPAKAKAKAKSR